jgi:hypothetical protein
LKVDLGQLRFDHLASRYVVLECTPVSNIDIGASVRSQIADSLLKNEFPIGGIGDILGTDFEIIKGLVHWNR